MNLWNSRTNRLGTLIVATGMVATACTESDLFVPPLILEHVIDNKVDVTGGFCAEGSSDLDAFLKIMLVIDRSNSMNVTDPTNQRVTAARDLVLRFVEDPVTFKLKAGVEIALLSFFGDVVVHSRNAEGLPGFSTDGPQILFSITQISQTGSNTGYDKALAQAFTLLDADMARLSDKARSLSRYETIFLSDGMPFPDNCRGEENAPSAAAAAVDRIQALATLHKVDHTFHTAFASHPGMFANGTDVDQCEESDRIEEDYNDSLGSETRALLQEMAGLGEGSFVQFDTGDSISFLDFDFAEARRIYALSNFVASNSNARPDFDRVQPDSDADGLTDDHEFTLGTSPYLTDSDFDGFNDALEWRFRSSGFDPLDPTDARCDELSAVDTDSDGLRDCEEAFLGTLRRSYDSDADGVPDPVEIRFGSNANSANTLQDGQTDSDADGGSNADEIRWHTDPNRDDVAERSKIAYDYYQRELPVTTGQACYDFTVTNIALADTNTAPVDQTYDGAVKPPGWNRIMLYMAQTPYDDPLAEPIYRVACVDARFVEDRDLKIPATGDIQIPLRRPSDTYRATDVLRPNLTRCNAAVNQDCGINALWCRYEDDGTCQCYDPPDDFSDPAQVDGINPRPCPPCANGVDDDGDGLTDYPFDPDCFDSLDTNEDTIDECSDGIDNDGDGRIDWPNDPACADGKAAFESPDPSPLPECFDGIDNDDDGAVDFPNDPGCYATSDATEAQSIINPRPACDDGVDNDGDGLVDLADPGCFDVNDIDEDGPSACFYCETATALKPGQCDLGTGFCKARSGLPNAPTPDGGCNSNGDCASGLCDTTTGRCVSACTADVDCRGAVCDVATGRCSPCLRDSDCVSGVCDAVKGWCLTPVYSPTTCTQDSDCPAGTCDVDLGFCSVDPFWGCRDERDCAPGNICSESRLFCQERVFETGQCNDDSGCTPGECNEDLGWCLPTQGSDQCVHDDECPFGSCLPGGYCDQQSFVFPEDFRPEVDCLISR